MPSRGSQGTMGGWQCQQPCPHPVRRRCPVPFPPPPPPRSLQPGGLHSAAGQLQAAPAPRDSDKQLYRLQGGPGGAGSTLLLAPNSPTSHLTCTHTHPHTPVAASPSPRALGPPGMPVTIPVPDPLPAKRKKMMMMETPEAPEVSTLGRAAPGEGGEHRLGPPPDVRVAPKGPEVPKKKQQQHKGEQLE